MDFLIFGIFSSVCLIQSAIFFFLVLLRLVLKLKPKFMVTKLIVYKSQSDTVNQGSRVIAISFSLHVLLYFILRPIILLEFFKKTLVEIPILSLDNNFPPLFCTLGKALTVNCSQWYYPFL